MWNFILKLLLRYKINKENDHVIPWDFLLQKTWLKLWQVSLRENGYHHIKYHFFHMSNTYDLLLTKWHTSMLWSLSHNFIIIITSSKYNKWVTRPRPTSLSIIQFTRPPYDLWHQQQHITGHLHTSMIKSQLSHKHSYHLFLICHDYIHQYIPTLFFFFFYILYMCCWFKPDNYQSEIHGILINFQTTTLNSSAKNKHKHCRLCYCKNDYHNFLIRS